ncbi:MAG: EF-hand domain pair [Chthoniobacter sp.]|jgi:hypothetical protein|nr:EF-hand domain pair [Chthoniobacter sp.]
MKIKTLLALLVVTSATSAFAADDAPAPKKRDPGRLFKNFDRDGNGEISLEEWKTTQLATKKMDPSRIEGVFKKKDLDGDGKLSLPEFINVPAREEVKPAAPAEKKDKKEKKEEK